MKKHLLCALFLVLNIFIFGQSTLSNKRFKMGELDTRTFAPIIINTLDGKTVMIFIRPRAIIGKNTTIFLTVFDDKWNKIAQKEHETKPEIVKIMGQMRSKIQNFSVDLFNVIDYDDGISLFYERSDVVAHIKISKKDWSIKQMSDITFDETKIPITSFEKDRTIVKTGVYNNIYYVLVPHKEDNQLWLYSLDKTSKPEKKLIKMPVIKQPKDNSKVKEVSFNKFIDIHQHDSLMVFLFNAQDDNDKIYQTIVLNLETQKTRTMKYSFPKDGFFKEKDKTHTMAYLFEEKVLLSVINDKKYALSIRNISTGEELKYLSFNSYKEIPIANTKISKRSIGFRGGLSNPLNYTQEDIKLEKYWDNFIDKGGIFSASPNAFGVIDVVKVDSFLRFSFGSEYISDVQRSNTRTDYGTGTTTTRTSSSKSKYDCDIVQSYVNSYLDSKSLNPISTRKEDSFEAEYEKIAQLESKICCLQRFRKNEKDYFVYYDKKMEEVVIVSLK